MPFPHTSPRSSVCSFHSVTDIIKRGRIGFGAPSLRIDSKTRSLYAFFISENPAYPALIRITVCNQTGCECIVCASNPSLMTGCVFMAHEFHEFSCKRAQPKMSRKGAFYMNVCARRAQRPSLLGLCRAAAKGAFYMNQFAQTPGKWLGRAVSPNVAHSPGQRPGGTLTAIDTFGIFASAQKCHAPKARNPLKHAMPRGVCNMPQFIQTKCRR